MSKVAFNTTKNQRSKDQNLANNAKMFGPLSDTISIAQVIKNVNNKNFVKYFPNNMLSNEQKEIKKMAVKNTLRETDAKNDKKYSKYINKGDIQSAKDMLKKRADEQGYTVDDDWKSAHKAPSREYDKPAYNLRSIYGEEIYSNMAARYYGDGAPFDQKAIDVIQSIKDNPEKVMP